MMVILLWAGFHVNNKPSPRVKPYIAYSDLSLTEWFLISLMFHCRRGWTVWLCLVLAQQQQNSYRLLLNEVSVSQLFAHITWCMSADDCMLKNTFLTVTWLRLAFFISKNVLSHVWTVSQTWPDYLMGPYVTHRQDVPHPFPTGLFSPLIHSIRGGSHGWFRPSTSWRYCRL